MKKALKEPHKERDDEARLKAASLLQEGTVVGVLGLRKLESHLEPYLFTTPGELEKLDTSGKYAIAMVARRLLQKWSSGDLAVVAHGCDERHLIELAKRGRPRPRQSRGHRARLHQGRGKGMPLREALPATR